ncbi:hypothetical protein BMS3Abin17_00661 [archaeon BMS3Abin17]|nr:hypothetical protein BMS3Abin17_00661 [archaeon BMS3Abin17]
MSIKQFIKPSLFKIIFTLILTLIISVFIYYSVLNALSVMGACAPGSECNYPNPNKTVLIFLFPTLLIVYLLSCIIEYIFKKYFSNNEPPAP